MAFGEEAYRARNLASVIRSAEGKARFNHIMGAQMRRHLPPEMRGPPVNDFDKPVRIFVNGEVFEGRQMRSLIVRAVERAKDHLKHGNAAGIEVRAESREFERAVHKDIMERLGEWQASAPPRQSAFR